MAISENDCPRLPQDKAVTVPMIEKGQELPQLVLDLRTVNAYQWKSTVIIYDMTLGGSSTLKKKQQKYLSSLV